MRIHLKKKRVFSFVHTGLYFLLYPRLFGNIANNSFANERENQYEYFIIFFALRSWRRADFPRVIDH